MIKLLFRQPVSRLFRRFALESSFKSKNILRDFVKYVHPDILVGAPERVKEENGRSMQLLNAYLDSLKKNEGSAAVEVRFYTPEKTNKKSRKFFYFKTRLDAFASQLREEDLDAMRKKFFNFIQGRRRAAHQPQRSRRNQNRRAQEEEPGRHQGRPAQGLHRPQRSDARLAPRGLRAQQRQGSLG